MKATAYEVLNKKYNKLKNEKDELEKENAEYKKQLKELKQQLNNKNNTNMNTRNILLIGRTGGGKSTLANVLVNKNGDFEEVFKESAGSTSQTKDAQVETFEHEGVEYKVIDTIGIGDTKLTEDEYFAKLSEVASKVKDGINQILFVVKGRFTEEEIKAYGRLVVTAFDDEATKYTSVVRVSFPEFANEGKCEEDRNSLLNEKDEIKNIVERIKFLYADNPPISFSVVEDESEEDSEIREMKVKVNKSTRRKSRAILLKYLKDQRGTYKPTNLDKLNEKLRGCRSEEDKARVTKEHTEERLSDMIKSLREECTETMEYTLERSRTETTTEIGRVLCNITGIGLTGAGFVVGSAAIFAKLFTDAFKKK